MFGEPDCVFAEQKGVNHENNTNGAGTCNLHSRNAGGVIASTNNSWCCVRHSTKEGVSMSYEDELRNDLRNEVMDRMADEQYWEETDRAVEAETEEKEDNLTRF